jgi:hypothetical protein
MPNLLIHETAAIRNQDVMRVMLERAESQFGTYAPWAATAAFYSAVHLVEGMFCMDCQKHSQDHYERNDRLRNSKTYSKLWHHYRYLYEMSMVSRYLTNCGDNVDEYFIRYFVSCQHIRSQIFDHHLHQIQKIFNERKQSFVKAQR